MLLLTRAVNVYLISNNRGWGGVGMAMTSLAQAVNRQAGLGGTEIEALGVKWPINGMARPVTRKFLRFYLPFYMSVCLSPSSNCLPQFILCHCFKLCTNFSLLKGARWVTKSDCQRQVVPEREGREKRGGRKRRRVENWLGENSNSKTDRQTDRQRKRQTGIERLIIERQRDRETETETETDR